MIALAAWSGTSTKPKPRLLWVFLSSPIRALMTSPNGLTSRVSSAAVVVKGRFPIYNILLIFLGFPCWQCTQIAADAQVIFRADVTAPSQFVTRLDRTFKGER